jgi:hypothetical protein
MEGVWWIDTEVTTIFVRDNQKNVCKSQGPAWSEGMLDLECARTHKAIKHLQKNESAMPVFLA